MGERDGSEDPLRETAARYRRLVDSTEIVVIEVDLEGRIVFVNAAIERSLGYRPEELIGRPATSLLPESGVEEATGRLERAAAGESLPNREVEAVTKSGERRIIVASPAPIRDEAGNVRGVASTGVDITDRVAARRALERSEMTFRTLAETAPVGIFLTDGEGGITYANPALCQMAGVASDRLTGTVIPTVHPDDIAAVAEARDRMVAERAPCACAGRFARADGSVRHWRTQTAPLWVGDELIGHVAVVVDTTDEVSRRDELIASEARYRRLVENPDVVTFELDPSGVVTYVNPAIERVLGYAAEEMVGRASLGFVGDADRELVSERLREAQRGRSIPPFSFGAIRKDATTASVRVAWAGVSGEDGELVRVVGTAIDVTEHERSREELERTVAALRQANAERAALVTQLIRAQDDERSRIAAAIHDESIQTLSASRLRLGLLAEDLTDPGPRGTVAEIDTTLRSAIRELRELVFELRPPVLEEAGLVAALREYLEHLHELVSIEIELAGELSHEPPESTAVVAYHVAREAVSNVRKHSRASRLTVRIRERERVLVVEIHDDGVGFEPEQTAGPGHIGLISMRERVEGAGGELRIESSHGAGTTVSFELPLSER